MSKEKSPAPDGTTRTRLEDLPPAVEELSEAEATVISGGALNLGNLGARKPLNYSGDPTYCGTCTAGNALTGPDTDATRDADYTS